MRKLLEDPEFPVRVSQKNDIRGRVAGRLSKLLLAAGGHVHSQDLHILFHHPRRLQFLESRTVAQACLEPLTFFPKIPEAYRCFPSYLVSLKDSVKFVIFMGGTFGEGGGEGCLSPASGPLGTDSSTH